MTKEFNLSDNSPLSREKDSAELDEDTPEEVPIPPRMSKGIGTSGTILKGKNIPIVKRGIAQLETGTCICGRDDDSCKLLCCHSICVCKKFEVRKSKEWKEYHQPEWDGSK